MAILSGRVQSGEATSACSSLPCENHKGRESSAVSPEVSACFAEISDYFRRGGGVFSVDRSSSSWSLCEQDRSQDFSVISIKSLEKGLANEGDQKDRELELEILLTELVETVSTFAIMQGSQFQHINSESLCKYTPSKENL